MDPPREMTQLHHCFRELPEDAKRKLHSFLLGPSCVTMYASGIKIEALFIVNEKLAKRKWRLYTVTFCDFSGS